MTYRVAWGQLEGGWHMPLGTFIAGRYSATYNAVNVGITRQGYTLEITPKEEMINETDAYGLSTIDWIIRGGDCFLQYVSREYMAGSLAPLVRNFTGTLGGMQAAASPVGRLASNVAQSMVLTAAAGTPAAAAPATLTALLSLLAPGYNTQILFDSRLREVPVRLQLLPNDVTGTLSWFTTT